ncbi:hypothetical protein WH91_13195 [Devosia psychrophila]|jgi:hypothetical protein|uniref:Uncharacterized protein n=1 Tax=Devosia psychrophila TaxID=728005 RepID=A0ABR5DX25_9HYPH|nr:hypothetical protein WH91_13195 [Devosia psychrophila]
MPIGVQTLRCFTLWLSIIPGRGGRLATFELTGGRLQMVVDGGEQATVTPVIEVALHCRWRWKILGQ